MYLKFVLMLALAGNAYSLPLECSAILYPTTEPGYQLLEVPRCHPDLLDIRMGCQGAVQKGRP